LPYFFISRLNLKARPEQSVFILGCQLGQLVLAVGSYHGTWP